MIAPHQGKTGAPEHPYRKIMAAKAAKKAVKKKGGKKRRNWR